MLVFNEEIFIARTIEIVLTQSHLAIELVIFDNRLTDDSRGPLPNSLPPIRIFNSGLLRNITPDWITRSLCGRN